MTTESQSSRSFGPYIFAAGILVAIAGSAKLPLERGQFPDTLPVFIVGAVAAAIGIYLWRRQIKIEQDQPDNDPNAVNPFERLESIQAPLADLGSDANGLTTAQLCDRVDAILQEYVVPFAIARNKVVEKLGMDKGAELLVVVAYGERMLNRAWSAAADEHAPESISSILEAIEAFKEVAP
ncbi:MAG: hypothetical protein HOI23_07080 [Deltaproteobacteria bacterium]|jgi:hypothetical protein|nr:hypothetical protein [Deltaproteobacteria bacterium]MBT6433160.1 hypothetical protein [Deltaproteobacteria bacterium]